MSLSPETRLSMLGKAQAAPTPELIALLADWSARCERITARAKAGIDPFTLALPAVLSPIGAPNATPWPDFTLAGDCRDDG